jgi:hypothetical protein
MTAVVITGLSAFNYSVLEPDVERDVRDAAEEIRDARGRHIGESLRIGRALLRAKAALPHGQFGTWLSEEFGWEERTAQRLVRAATTFGENPTCVSGLPLRIVYLLSEPSTPVTVRDQVIERLDRGERPGEQEIADLIKHEKQEQRKAIRAAKTPEALKQKEQRFRARLEKVAKASAARREKERSAAREAAALVRDRQGDDDFAALVRRLDEADGWSYLAMELRRLAGSSA